MARESIEKSPFPAVVQDYLDRIEGDILTVQNLPVVEELLLSVQQAGKMDELAAILVRHGEIGLQSPYSEIVHSSNFVLDPPKKDGRCITLMSASREALLSSISAQA